MLQHAPIFAGWQRLEKGLGLPADSVHTFGSGNGLRDKLRRKTYRTLGGAANFARVLAEREAVLAHAHFSLDAAVFLPIAQKLRIPFVVTLHGYDVTTEDSTLRKSVLGRVYLDRKKQLWENADRFFCVSEFIRQSAIDRGYPKEKLLTHYIGIDAKAFTPDISIKREPIVLFVGRLVEKKGCVHLIRAMAQVEARFPLARLVVIGDGPLRAELEATAGSLLRRCQFLGVQSAQSIKQWLNRSRVFCVPSVIASGGDAEGFGIVFSEAQAMGVPVVSFATGGIPEAVIHGEGGLLAPERDEKTLAEYISLFLEDDEEWERASRAGRQWVERAFDLEKQTRLLEQHYFQHAEGADQNPL
jgi:glycosyltransferase involved in cell wall biosynthesis